MLNKQLISICIILFLAVLSGCQPSIISQENISKYNYVLAEADGNYKLTVPDFYQKIAKSEILGNGGLLDKNSAEHLIDSFLVDTLIGMRAATIDLRDNYDDYIRFRESAAGVLVNAYYQHAIFEQIVVDSQEVLDYFAANQEAFKIEEQILVRHIVITGYGFKKGADSLEYKEMTNEQLEEIARQMAFELREKIDSKESFMEIAKKYSHDELSARRGGLIEWGPKGYYASPFDSLAFSAKVGDFVGPYRDKDGWQILYIENYMAPGVPPLNPQIYNESKIRVQNEKSRQASIAVFDTLFDEMKIEYNEELYDTNVYFVDKPVWAAVVNGTDTMDFGELSSGEEKIRQLYKVDNSTPEMKKEMVQFLARRWVIVQTARRMGLDTLPEVVEKIANTRHYFARLIVESFRSDPNWEPSVDEMRKYYETNRTKYAVTKPLRVQQILVTDSSMAEFVKDQAGSGVDFLQLAEEYYTGEKSVRRDLADLGLIGPEDVSPEFFEAARAVRAGEVSDPVKTEFGFHIIKVLESKWSVPFENARGGIRTILKSQHVTGEIENFKNVLFKEFHVKKTGRVSPMHFKPYQERQSAA